MITHRIAHLIICLLLVVSVLLGDESALTNTLLFGILYASFEILFKVTKNG